MTNIVSKIAQVGAKALASVRSLLGRNGGPPGPSAPATVVENAKHYKRSTTASRRAAAHERDSSRYSHVSVPVTTLVNGLGLRAAKGYGVTLRN